MPSTKLSGKAVSKTVPKPADKLSIPAAKKAATAKPAVPAALPTVHSKPKLVRDSFTIPKAEYLVLDSLKLRAAGLARPVKKSELLRAGIKALQAMTDRSLLAALNGVPSLKTGRPKGAEAAVKPSKPSK